MQIDKICFPANTLKRWLQIRSVQVLFCFSELLFDLSDSFWSMEVEIESRLFGYLTSNPIEINNALFNRIWEGTHSYANSEGCPQIWHTLTIDVWMNVSTSKRNVVIIIIFQRRVQLGGFRNWGRSRVKQKLGSLPTKSRKMLIHISKQLNLIFT